MSTSVRHGGRGGGGAGPGWARAAVGCAQRGWRRDRDGPGVADLVAATSATSAGGDAGPDVVIVPGLAVSDYLREAQDRIAASTRVHLLDLPGVGAAADVDRPPTLRDDAAAVTGWLRARMAGAVILVGHSYGTQVAVRAAAADGRLVRGLVLASPTVDPAYRSAARLLPRWLRDLSRQPEGPLRLNRPQQRRAGRRRLFAMVASMLADDPEHWLVQVDAPVSVLLGNRDVFVTGRWVRRLADRPDAALTRVPGGTHTFPFDHPEALVSAVRAIAERTERG
ncbi:MAG: alpha/beta fold hydrolase [Actinophytocola sp.]|nr:alpha/beta fold hydrolase [Actinophytocola sp.]